MPRNKIVMEEFKRADKKRTVALRRKVIDEIVAFIRANPRMTVDAIAMETDVVPYKINAILECVPEGKQCVMDLLVCPPARGFPPAWTSLVADPSTLPQSASTSRALVPVEPISELVTDDDLRADSGELIELYQKAISRRSPRAQKRMMGDFLELVETTAERTQIATNTVVKLEEEKSLVEQKYDRLEKTMFAIVQQNGLTLNLTDQTINLPPAAPAPAAPARGRRRKTGEEAVAA